MAWTALSDPENPENDQLGLIDSSGAYRSAPGFTGWPTMVAGAVTPGMWRHIGIAIHSEGAETTLAGRSVYKSGSVARYWYFGHALGREGVDVSGMRTAESTKILVHNVTGKIIIDEVSVWKRDWSDNGQNRAPFGDGRGSGTSPR